MKLGWMAMLVVALAGAAGAQTATPGNSAPTVGTGQAGTAAEPTRVYKNPELHLTYWYPAELTPQDASTAKAAGLRLIYGADVDTDPDHPKTDSCTKVMLAVGKDAEGNGAGAGESSGPDGVWVRVALFDVDVRCLPPQALRKKKVMDAALTNLVGQGTTEMGMMPIEQPTFYDIQGQRAHFCAAQGTPVTKSDLQSSATEAIGVMAVPVGGHVVSWVMETNNLAMFNRLLGSQVDLGAGKPQRLVPVKVQ